ncbi:MAG TPA: hypothetical protein VKB49_04615 [Candidatus Sulfotelmatobacter sp.]|nr:hypothetical protein [Candidatus Sulfotelmatobacter sp.]
MKVVLAAGLLVVSCALATFGQEAGRDFPDFDPIDSEMEKFFLAYRVPRDRN